MKLRSVIQDLTNEFTDATGKQPSTVSTIVFNDGKRLSGYLQGRDLRTESVGKLLTYFAEHWPHGRAYPEGSVPVLRLFMLKDACLTRRLSPRKRGKNSGSNSGFCEEVIHD